MSRKAEASYQSVNVCYTDNNENGPSEADDEEIVRKAYGVCRGCGTRAKWVEHV